MLRRLRFFGHVIRSAVTPMRIIHVPSMPASMTRRRIGNDLVVALVKHGYALSRTTSNIRTWGCGRPDTELMTVICGVVLWKRRRSCRGMLHDDDDDEPTRGSVERRNNNNNKLPRAENSFGAFSAWNNTYYGNVLRVCWNGKSLVGGWSPALSPRWLMAWGESRHTPMNK